MLVGLFIGVVVAVGVALYLNRNNNPFTASGLADKPQQPAQQAAPAAVPPESLKPGAGTKQPPAPPVQSYDFYKILPGNEDPNVALPPKPEGEAATTEKAVVPQVAWFQVGAFQNEADADNLKATLALKGIEASIQTTNLPEKGIWHRVRVGPLKSAADVEKTRNTLRANVIEANLIQPKENKPAVQ